MFAGFDIGGTNIKSVLTDNSGKILSSIEAPTPSGTKEIDEAIARLVKELALTASVSAGDIRAIGIGAAGSINRNKGTVIISPNIPSWSYYPLCRKVEKLTGIKVYLENDATAACAGVWWKKIGDKYNNWIMITLGTGIGGGAVLNGRLFTGQTGSSMEIGHMSIDPRGPLCQCGNRGCFELYASATALVKQVKLKMKKFPSSPLKSLKKSKLTARRIYEEGLKNDPLALEGLEYVATYLGVGITNLINIFNPEAIIIGGGLSRAWDLISPKMKEVIDERGMKGLKENVKIITVKEHPMIAALGAAKIAFERFKEENKS